MPFLKKQSLEERHSKCNLTWSINITEEESSERPVLKHIKLQRFKNKDLNWVCSQSWGEAKQINKKSGSVQEPCVGCSPCPRVTAHQDLEKHHVSKAKVLSQKAGSRSHVNSQNDWARLQGNVWSRNKAGVRKMWGRTRRILLSKSWKHFLLGQY